MVKLLRQLVNSQLRWSRLSPCSTLSMMRKTEWKLSSNSKIKITPFKPNGKRNKKIQWIRLNYLLRVKKLRKNLSLMKTRKRSILCSRLLIQKMRSSAVRLRHRKRWLRARSTTARMMTRRLDWWSNSTNSKPTFSLNSRSNKMFNKRSSKKLWRLGKLSAGKWWIKLLKRRKPRWSTSLRIRLMAMSRISLLQKNLLRVLPTESRLASAKMNLFKSLRTSSTKRT